jgi:hypothetical protein
MTLAIDELAAYMQTRGLGTVGTDIYKFVRPPTPVVCTSVHPTGGWSERYGFTEKPTFMIYARAATPKAAMERAYAAWNALHRQQNVQLATLYALTIEASNSPLYLDTEQAGNSTAHLCAFNITMHLRRASS